MFMLWDNEFIYLSFLIWVIFLGSLSVDLTLGVWGLTLCPKTDLESAEDGTVVEQVDLDTALRMSSSLQGWRILSNSESS